MRRAGGGAIALRPARIALGSRLVYTGEVYRGFFGQQASSVVGRDTRLRQTPAHRLAMRFGLLPRDILDFNPRLPLGAGVIGDAVSIVARGNRLGHAGAGAKQAQRECTR